VNDKTDTPDQPERSGSVATGDQRSGQDPAVPPPKPAAPGGAGGSAPARGGATAAAGAAGLAPDQATRPVTSPAADEPGPAARGATEKPVAPKPAASPKPAPKPGAEKAPEQAGEAPGLFEKHRIDGADAPTTRIRLPEGNGAAGRTAGGDAAKAAAAPAKAAARQPRPSGNLPADADDATVTRPGPAAPAAPVAPPQAPPPWNRVPGQEAANQFDQPPQVVATNTSVGELLQEGPTTYIDVNDRGIHLPREASEAGEEPASSRSGGWPAARPGGRNRPPRQAALQLKRLDPWSVLKLALVLAVVLFFIWLVAVGVLYGALDGMGVWDKLNGTYSDLVSGQAATGSPLISAGRVLGLAAVVGAINSLLFAVAATVAAFVYNVSADLVGGIEVTLSERD
jgi:hypothetical protein